MTRAEKAALSTQRELTQIESSVSLLKQQTASAEKEIKEIDLQIAEETENQDLATAISDAEEEIRVRTESVIAESFANAKQTTMLIVWLISYIKVHRAAEVRSGFLSASAQDRS